MTHELGKRGSGAGLAHWLPAMTLVMLLSCVMPTAYGPSGDDRLAEAVSGGERLGDSELLQLGEIQENSCSAAVPVLEQLRTPPGLDATVEGAEEESANKEEEHLASLTGVVRELRRRQGAVSDILAARPDLQFFSGEAPDGRYYDVPSLVRECETLLDQGELLLDSFIREILSMPIISDVRRVGRRVVTVPRERVDFALLATSVEILAPFDADSLMSRVDAARTRLEEEAEQARRPTPRRRR